MWQGLLPFRILVNSVRVCVCDTRCTWLRRGWWRRWWCWRCWGDGAPNLEARWNCATQTQSLWYLLETKKKKKKKYVNVSSVYDESQSTPVPRQGNSSRLLAQIHSRRSSIEPCQVGGWMNGWRYIWRICWDGMALQGFLTGWVLRMFGQQQGATSLFVRLDSFLFLVIFVDSHTHIPSYTNSSTD